MWSAWKAANCSGCRPPSTLARRVCLAAVCARSRSGRRRSSFLLLDHRCSGRGAERLSLLSGRNGCGRSDGHDRSRCGDFSHARLAKQAGNAGLTHGGEVGGLLASTQGVVGHEGVRGNTLSDSNAEHGNSGCASNQTSDFLHNSHFNFSFD